MNENDTILTPVEQLTQIVCQILDDHAERIFNVNLHSNAGRQIIGELVASQLIDSPGMVVVDPTQATDEQRQMVDAIMMQDLAEGERN
tara:strand:+ start:1474 stop:1737 length:264 start_codon:yes stop_codon:yes gene_type:complete